MNLSLKNIKYYDERSEETFCFSAELAVDGKSFAHLDNDGKGGATTIIPFVTVANSRELIKQAIAYAKSLPAYQVPIELGGHTLPMDLDFWISLEIEKLPVS